MKVGFKYRKSGHLPEVKVPGTFYYLVKEHPELWFCFDENTVKRIDNELLADEINDIIKDYLDKNGVDLDGYATDSDLEDYALKSDIPTRVEDLEDGSDYVTKEYLEGVIGEIPSLGGYATEEWVRKQGYVTDSDLGDYVTMSDIPTRVGDLEDASDYLTRDELISLIDKMEYATMSDIPTRVSDLQDASDYLTEKDLENYYTKEEVDKKIRWKPFS